MPNDTPDLVTDEDTVTDEPDEDRLPDPEVLEGDDVEDLEDAEDTDDGDGRPSPPRDRAFAFAAVVAVVFAVLFVATAILFVADHNKKANDSDRQQIQLTASRAAEAITTVDPANGDAAQTLHDVGTGPLIDQYDQISGPIKQAFTALHVVSMTGKSQGVYVKDPDGSQADAIVRLDIVVIGDNPHTVHDQYLEVHVVKIDNAWKADNITVLNLSLGSGQTGTSPSTTPSTTGSSTPATAPPATSSSSS